MQVVFHIGAHCTDEGRLVRTLLKNRDVLAGAGTHVPGPGKYRQVLRDAVNQLRGAPASRETQDVVLEAIDAGAATHRIVLSNESFVSVHARALDEGTLYPRAYKTTWLRNVFPDDEVEFFLAIRDPAAFVPAIFATQPDRDFRGFVGEIDPAALRWSDLVARIREANPDSPITVWCNEDTPLIWPEVIREIGGVDALTPIEGGLEIAEEIMTEEGGRRLRAYLASHPPQTAVMQRRVIAAFLDKFAREEALEEELDLPGWTAELIAMLGEAYEEDLFEIARLPGVTLIAP